MSKRKLTIAFLWHPHTDSPEFLSAYDDVIEDAWGGTPDYFQDDVSNAKAEGGDVREVVITVPEETIQALFASPEIEGTIET